MVDVVLSGKEVSQEVREGLRLKIQEMRGQGYTSFKPGLIIVQVRNIRDSRRFKREVAKI